ncbi:hypothetical protein B0J18DRAFT_407791 [Chaetomium sp. MPI-SDFR-AT-0129]|nr:hypothetical protein B0J18DRAFT_407791 [Chaetomium sp. MPI-SDFR-AT-0129]
MKFTTLLTTAILPLALHATLLTSTSSSASLEVTALHEEGDKLLEKRTDHICNIVNAPSGVNCRSGPGTQYSVIGTVKNGQLFYFPCYKSGECITVGGVKNCGWDALSFQGFGQRCYVSGHYTDDNCTAAKLGKC